MDGTKTWIAPDGLITKTVVASGKFGLKPTENSECSVKLSHCTLDVGKYNSSPVVVGDSDCEFGRLLDKCLMMMNQGEVSTVTFVLKGGSVSFTLELEGFTSDGYVYQWDAQKKYHMAMAHKVRGVELFKTSICDASHRFVKAVKLLAAIPIQVDKPPTDVDGLSFADLQSLKGTLYNNLASCYLKHCDYSNVIVLSKKVLSIDSTNVKALYKLGVAYDEIGEFDDSCDALRLLLSVDPNNGAALSRLKGVSGRINQKNATINAMYKRMFI